MADEEYNRKLESLQQYIPFLNNMITQLKDPRKKNREQQLTKMVSLHSMITDKKKKLKLETLVKCEDVILKLYDKVKSGTSFSTAPPPSSSKPIFSAPITPSSPSPPPDIPLTKPVVIPTEKIERDSQLYSIDSPTSISYTKPKIDIYGSAVVNIKKRDEEATSNEKKIKEQIFEEIGKKVPDMSKPPISFEDLEALQEDDTTVDNMSLNELNDLREQLQKQLSTGAGSNNSSDSEKHSEKSINTTVRNTTILTKKAVAAAAAAAASKTSTMKAKPVKHVKEQASIFGTALSSIDNHIFETNKLKERRVSNSDKPLGGNGGGGGTRRKSTSSTSSSSNESLKKTETNNEKKPMVVGGKKMEEATTTKPVTYKRLADKYNPKPRKPSIETTTPQPVPPPKIPPLPPSAAVNATIASILPNAATPTKIIHPQPSPTLSTHSSIESEFIGTVRKLPYHHQQQQQQQQHFKPIQIQSRAHSQFESGNFTAAAAGNEFYAQPNRPSTPFRNASNIVSPPPPPAQFDHLQRRVLTPVPVTHQPIEEMNFTRDVDWRREPPWRETPARDPRLNRAETPHPPPRGFGSRDYDERLNYTASTAAPSSRKDFRHQGNTNSGKTRSDPRIHRSQSTTTTTSSRFDAKHSEPVAANPPPISESNHFQSPLDSLYSGGEGFRRTGKGYGVQNYKIPRIKNTNNDEPPPPPPPPALNDKKVDVGSSSSVSSSSEITPPAVLEEKSLAPTTPIEEVAEISSTNDMVSTDEKNDVKPVTAVAAAAPVPKVEKDKTEIINEFLQKLLQDSRTASAATNFIEKVSNSLDDEKLKLNVIQTSTETEAEQRKVKLIEERRQLKLKRKMKLLQKQQRKKLALLKLKKKKVKAIIESSSSSAAASSESESEEEVVRKTTRNAKAALSKKNKQSKKEMTNRRKTKQKQTIRKKPSSSASSSSSSQRKKEEQAASVVPVKKPRRKQRSRRPTELDRLHENIQEMFIRDGVLHATGRRLCRSSNEQSSTTSRETSPIKPAARRTRTKVAVAAASAKKFDSNASENKEKLKQMSNVRVVITKIPIEAPHVTDADDNEKRYSLRRTSKQTKSYKDLEHSDEESPSSAAASKKTIKIEQEPKAIEGEPEKKEKEKEKEKEEETVDEDKTKPVVVPKRQRARKRVREKNDENEDATSASDFIEPDKNYYPRAENKRRLDCKLCNFSGKHITGHYRYQHPDSEILSSRLSPSRVVEARQEADSLNLDKISKPGRIKCSKKFLFKCRFCDLELNQRHASFYDHVSTHTGEYRHSCSYCPFAGCNMKSMRTHHIRNHSGKRVVYNHVLVKHEIFGYLCTECNYVQMSKENVESHVNIFHLGEGKKIVRIYLSSVRQKGALSTQRASTSSEDEDEEEEVDDESETVKDDDEDVDHDDDADAEEKKLLEPPRVKKQKTMDGAIVPDLKKIKIEKLDDEVEVESFSPPKLTAEIKKEIDMTVFTCNTNIDEEIEEIEAERLKTMSELNESVKTTRQSLNFVTSFLNERLGQDEAPPHEEPLPPPALSPMHLLEEEEKPQKRVKKMIQHQSTTSSEELSSSSSSGEVVEKANTFMLGLVAKLKGILKNDAVLPPPPPPSHPLAAKSFVNFGVFRILNEGETVEFACRVPSCRHIAKTREAFREHWNGVIHQRFNANTSELKCEACEEIIAKTDDENNLLIQFFDHVACEHFPSELKPPESETQPTPEEDQDLEEDKSEECNPFPFKIADVISLASESSPDASPAPAAASSSTDGLSNVTVTAISSVAPPTPLKEITLKPCERNITWKCSIAYANFMKIPKLLYKCPQFYCQYATEHLNNFNSHTRFHSIGIKSEEFVRCVYCDVKTLVSQSGAHIQARHANNMYSCSKCLYRALFKEYVVVHMRKQHNRNEMILAIPAAAKLPNKIDEKYLTVAQACPPYSCGFDNCGLDFLFESEFKAHLISHKEGEKMRCGFKRNKCRFECVEIREMVDHWNYHGCYAYHCLFCKKGTKLVVDMLGHYSERHQHMSPMVVSRVFGPILGNLFYNEEAFAAVTYVTEKTLKESVNVKATESGLKMVPLRVFKKFPTDKKIIAVIPNQLPTSTDTLIIKSKPDENESTIEEITSQDKKSEEEEPSNSHEIVFVDEKDKTEEPEPDNTSSQASNTTDPLSMDQVAIATSSVIDDSDSNDGVKSGLVGYQLYKCAFCKFRFENSRLFKLHFTKTKDCQDIVNNPTRPFKCAHCERLFKNLHGLYEHVQYHGQLRFFCSLCERKFPSLIALKIHMRHKHNVIGTITTPLLQTKTDMECDEFVLRPKPVIEGEMCDPPKASSSANKSTFQPNEIEEIPQRCIFEYELKCGLCAFTSKVRMNLVRHLELHVKDKNFSVPYKAPVNPVPCLERNEKMFDKMTNLAISSFTGGRMGGPAPKPKTETKNAEEVEVPEYVPAHRRFACASPGCNYLCPEEANLRHHLFALHAAEKSFICAHCTKKETLNDIETFLKHLKLHDLHLYKCNYCNFFQNVRYKVEKHAGDKHGEKSDAASVTIRALDAEIVEDTDSENRNTTTTPVPTSSAQNAASLSSPQQKGVKCWYCGICKYRSCTENEVMLHVFNKHDMEAQFKCTLCIYKSNDKSTFHQHFKENHPGSEINIIDVYYKNEKLSSSAQSSQQVQQQNIIDTTPLWQRDRPRVRHIRGILIEEASPVKLKKTNAGKAVASTSFQPVAGPSGTQTSVKSNLDLAIDAVARGAHSVTQKIEEEEEDEDNEVQAVEAEAAEEEELPVIVIEDEEMEIDEEFFDDDELIDAEMLTKQTKDFLVDIESGEFNFLTENVDEDDPLMLTKDKLLNMYGQICSPVGKCFRCPICYKYKTKRIAYFTHHLLTELNCHRLKCKSCDFKCLTNEIIMKHCSEEHNLKLAENIIDVPLDKTVEYWLQILLQHQAKCIIDSSVLPVAEDSNSANIKHKCEHCQKTFKSLFILKEHQLQHWANPTYTCGNCPNKFSKIEDFLEHSRQAHRLQECKLDAKASFPYVGMVLKNLREPPALPSGLATNAEDKTYLCNHCGDESNTMMSLKNHHCAKHASGGLALSFKVMRKSKIFACSYCHERNTEEELRRHCAMNHPAVKFNMYQFICLECPASTFQSIKELRPHFSRSHYGKRLTYSCIELKTTMRKAEEFCCTKCPYRGCSIGGMRSHVRKHLRPFDCMVCGATFIQPIDGRSHHVKEHLHSKDSIEENKHRIKEYEETIFEIVKNKEKVVLAASAASEGASVSTSSTATTSNKKMMARKSTGAPFVREFSYYGTGGGDSDDLKKISTSIE